MTRRPPTRAAFTLVELLVVISIIAVLMGLLLPAVQKIRGTGPRVVAKNDITSLDDACTQFRTKYGFYPPSPFVIPTRIDQPGFEVYKRMFPRWNPPVQADMVTIQVASQPAGAGTGLAGSQCLVHFLGGPAGTGWAVDAPVAPSANAVAKNVFMDFPAKKLTAQGAFLDPWDTPYAYFSSSAGGNYPVFRIDAATTGYVAGNFMAAYPVPVTPPPAAVPGVMPFYSGVKAVNQGNVQIISAGQDKVFGPGDRTWAPGSPAYVLNGPPGGGDDIANFNEGRQLGSQ